jgi:fumarate hydratase class I
VSDPLFSRKNTQDNTPAVIHTKLVKGDKLDVTVAAKGGGSENKSKFTVLNPDDNLTDWVLRTIPTMGAGWCPPGMIGIGVGGTVNLDLFSEPPPFAATVMSNLSPLTSFV